MKKAPQLSLDNMQPERPTMQMALGNLNLSPSDSMCSQGIAGPFTITPSNLFMGINSTTAANQGGLLSTSNRTPKGLLTNKMQGSDKNKLLLTPIAYSPLNKNN